MDHAENSQNTANQANNIISSKQAKKQLFEAIKKGSLSHVNEAINNGADVNKMNKNRATPLHYASSYGHLDVVKYLVVERKADINKVDNGGVTPFEIAEQRGFENIAKFLAERKEDNAKKYLAEHGINVDSNFNKDNADYKNQDTKKIEEKALKYLNTILPEGLAINSREETQKRHKSVVAYYKYLGGICEKQGKFSQYSIKQNEEAFGYLGYRVKTVQNMLQKLTEAQFNEIEAKDIKAEADKILNKYKKDHVLVDAIVGLKDRGFTCRRIIELLGIGTDL